MEKQYFIQLLHKYLKGKSTIEEDDLIISYYNLFENEPDILELLNQETKDDIKANIYAAIQEQIAQREKQSAKVRYMPRWVITTAAAAVLVLVSLNLVYLLNRNPTVTPQQKAIVLETVKKRNRVFNLPDGSTVILSAGSKLNYPSSFDGLEKREVFLEGQAFFDVKHNATKSFIVHAGKLVTTVLGTAFNIKAIPGESDITVTVTRGRVKVQNKNKILGILTPNQQIIYNTDKVSSIVKIVDTDSDLDWKEQDLIIDNLTVGEVGKLLEQRFKVKITIADDSLYSQHFTTTFSKEESFEQIIKNICLFNGVEYKFNKEKATVIIGNGNK